MDKRTQIEVILDMHPVLLKPTQAKTATLVHVNVYKVLSSKKESFQYNISAIATSEG